MLKTYRIIPLVFILFLFGFSLGIPLPGFTQTDHTSTYTPNIAVGPHLFRALSTGGGNGDYILYGRDKTQDWCERLLFKETSDLRLGVEVIHIQYSKQYCYYYGAETAGAKNAGVGGPHIWTYVPDREEALRIKQCKEDVYKLLRRKGYDAGQSGEGTYCRTKDCGQIEKRTCVLSCTGKRDWGGRMDQGYPRCMINGIHVQWWDLE